MEIREATPEDLDAIADVWERVAAERIYIGAEPPLDRTARVAKWSRRYVEEGRGTMLVAEIDGDVIGSASVTGSGLYDLGMAVLREYRRQGIGTALLEAAVAWARDHGGYKMTLQVWPHNLGAIALYEKHGFEREGYLKRHYRRASGEIWDAVIMGLRLD
jgi:ribosomal protein S18 acetylase RimI-like enzyme